MKKMFLLLLLASLLAACGQSVGEPTNAPATAVPATQPPAEEEEEQADNPPAAAPPAEAGSYIIASSVAEAAQVRATDWAKGATDPLVSIIEYGDFQ